MTPGFLTPTNYEIINIGCFKVLNFKISCHEIITNIYVYLYILIYIWRERGGESKSEREGYFWQVNLAY